MLTLNDGRSELWQWDTGRQLTVDADCSQVHFSNKVFGRSIDVDVIDGIAIVPDILLQTDKDLNVWAFVGTAENGYTKISKTFKVNRRNKPSDYVFTPTEQTTLAELVDRLDKIEESQDPDAIKNAVEDYLEQNPVDVPVQSVNGKTGKVELTAENVGAISRGKLQEATNEALAQAKASGEFDGKDGKDGYTPIKGVDYFDGQPGQPGKDGEPGKDYILTEADKQKIAEQAAELVDVPESDLSGLVKSVNGIEPDENGNVEVDVSGGGSKTLCTFLDAYVAWCNGETFPVAFYGDSTFCGAYGPGVSGAFPALLQAILREECGENATIYNASNSGHSLVNGINNFDTYFGESGTYADSKMVGIGFGINDRLSHSNYKEYKETVYANLETIVNKCFERGIQPFLVTSHATNECGVATGYAGSYALRSSGAINIAANGAKKELAEKYGIPLIDLNKFTELFMVKSKVAAKDISADRLHYTATGNNYEAGVMFSQFVPRTIFTNGKEENAITYSSQNLTSAVPEDKISYGGEYKVFANYTKEDTTDTKIMDVYLFVYDSAVPVYALKNIAESATYVLVNGTKYAMADISEFLGEFDLGLHHLEVYTGESNIVDFCAFSINGDIVAATGVNLSTYALTVDQRKSYTITATPEPENAYGMVLWSSSNEEVVTVSDGVVSLVGEGDAIVIAKIGANEAQCAVTVANLAQYSEMTFDIDQTTGEVIAGSKSVSDLVSVEPGYQYYISTDKPGGLYPTVAGYTEDGIFIKMLATGNAQYNAHYDIAEWESIRKIRIAWKPFNASNINVREPIRTNNGVWSTKVYAINTETGEIGVSTNWLKYSITLQRIPVEAGTPYLVKSTIDQVYGDRIVLLEYDADGEFVKGYDADVNVNKIEFTSTANTASVMLAFSTIGSGKLQITKVE